MRLNPKYIKLTPETRLHKLDIPVIGLTGGIATGKSTVAEFLMQKGVPVINADHLVKNIYRLNESISFIEENCPEAVKQGEIDFKLLRERFFQSEELKTAVEGFIYPRLASAFYEALKKLGKVEVVVYDVPLLYERNLARYMDLTVVVYAPRKIQKARLMVRDNQLEEMAEKILDQQMDIDDKKLKADFVIHNGGTITELVQETEQFMRMVLT